MNCRFVTDAAIGFGLIHCQAKEGHEGNHTPPRGFLVKTDSVWRKYEVAPSLVHQQAGICLVCGGCTVSVDHDCPYAPCKCGGDPENILPKEY